MFPMKNNENRIGCIFISGALYPVPTLHAIIANPTRDNDVISVIDKKILPPLQVACSYHKTYNLQGGRSCIGCKQVLFLNLSFHWIIPQIYLAVNMTGRSIRYGYIRNNSNRKERDRENYHRNQLRRWLKYLHISARFPMSLIHGSPVLRCF